MVSGFRANALQFLERRSKVRGQNREERVERQLWANTTYPERVVSTNKTAKVILTIVVNDEESRLESAEFIRAVQRPTGRKTCLMLNAGATSQS
ncbi:hypothetical protein ALC53_06764 [Atta colombica]|uniref:Uncharacterized protein n=1 Tax=Atta colombica TaxID=520822 RepID=A0A151I361_9HYME|nr:hypothetical protein ALC53_06764 [Atta colombica]